MFPESNQSQAKTLEILSSDPSIYNAIDYWAVDGGGHGGHGLKYQSGPQPNEDPLAALLDVARADITWIFKREGLFDDRDSWHAGQGVVGRLDTDSAVVFVMWFQILEPSSRPDNMTTTVIAKDGRFTHVIQEIDTNPALLLDLFKKSVPEDEKNRIDGVTLVSDRPIDIGDKVRERKKMHDHNEEMKNIHRLAQEQTKASRLGPKIGRVVRNIFNQ